MIWFHLSGELAKNILLVCICNDLATLHSIKSKRKEKKVCDYAEINVLRNECTFYNFARVVHKLSRIIERYEYSEMLLAIHVAG